MFPDNTSRAIDVDQFKSHGVARFVVCEDDSTLESGVGPLMRIGMGIENASKCSTENFVGALGDGIFDFGFLFGCECRHLAKKEREREREISSQHRHSWVTGLPCFVSSMAEPME